MSLVNRFSTSDMELVSKFQLSYLLKWKNGEDVKKVLEDAMAQFKMQLENEIRKQGVDYEKEEMERALAASKEMEKFTPASLSKGR